MAPLQCARRNHVHASGLALEALTIILVHLSADALAAGCGYDVCVRSVQRLPSAGNQAALTLGYSFLLVSHPHLPGVCVVGRVNMYVCILRFYGQRSVLLFGITVGVLQ